MARALRGGNPEDRAEVNDGKQREPPPVAEVVRLRRPPPLNVYELQASAESPIDRRAGDLSPVGDVRRPTAIAAPLREREFAAAVHRDAQNATSPSRRHLGELEFRL